MKSPLVERTSFEGLEDLARRISNLVRIGTIAEVDYNAAKVKVNYGQDPNGGDLISGWLPWLTQRAGNDRDWHAPETGEQVMLISPNGELRLGVAFPALYQSAHPAPANAASVRRTIYADGAVIEYDRAAHRLTATLPNGGTTVLTSPGGVQINGKTTINGEVIINGSTQLNGGDVTADGISLKTHTHPGDSGGTTGQPQ